MSSPIDPQSAVVLFSGGQDSTTCLYWALQRFRNVHAVIFDYGQRHRIEIAQAQAIAQAAKVPSVVLQVPALQTVGGSSLTDTALALPQTTEVGSQLPNTFVPGRNLLFFTLAGGYAYLHGVPNLVGGMNQTDYSGYPDCRQPFIDAAQQSLSLAMDYPFSIHTPLMNLDKAAIWKLAADLGCLEVVIKQSHTCYAGDRTTLHPWGYGCGTCAACQLRRAGFEQAFDKKAPTAAGPA
jgi:7-cyano-7-deazaguanine synthase